MKQGHMRQRTMFIDVIVIGLAIYMGQCHNRML